ncbi:MAG TPA: hypothetical protein ENH28_06580 [Euryarchaeota archaeon]|nr:hypothetical protein BMS3Bbin15_00434 [archaeon BMS3Bbin15]HDL15796.1 hypothetical protein [Euryarchaeota archaeon]
MQKLLVEFQNTSGAPPQVPCSVSEALNREETLSVSRIVQANNSSEEDQHSGKSEQDLRVPVLNMHKKPCLPVRAKKSEQIEIPAGLDWIKIIIFKEVKRAIPPPIEMGGLLAQLL